jgi:hypothetical protein
MKFLILTILTFIGFNAFSQADLLHENGDIAYDSSFNCIYYANKDVVYFSNMKTFYYKGKIKAFDSNYKNIYYSDGNIAYNNLTKTIYFSNGNTAFNSKTGILFDTFGKILKLRSEVPDEEYIIEEKNIKFSIRKDNSINTELKIDDEDFEYITDLNSYIKIFSKKEKKFVRDIKIRI